MNVDLFGNDAAVHADTSLLGSPTTVDLFSTNGPTAAIHVGGILGGIDVIVDLFGNGGGGDGGGGDGGGGDGGGGDGDGNGGNGPGGNGGGAGPGLFDPGNGTRVASIGGGDVCFAPDQSQIANLIARHSYTQSLMRSWAGTTKLKVVKVGLCASTRSSLASLLAGNANISRLQNYLAGFPAINAGLKKQGTSASHVIAVDRSGSTLVVYVI